MKILKTEDFKNKRFSRKKGGFLKRNTNSLIPSKTKILKVDSFKNKGLSLSLKLLFFFK